MKRHAEVFPVVFHDGIVAAPVGLQGPYAPVQIAEVNERATQSGPQPQRAHLPAVHLLEDEDAATLLGMEARALDDAHQGINAAVAVDIARAKAVDGVGQSPVVQPVEAVVYLAETVGFVSSVRISASTSLICDERL